MRSAVDLGKKSVPESNRPNTPKVGVVIVRDDEILGQSWRGETGAGRHAEYGLLKRLEGVDLAGSHAFTTLEPCSKRNHPKQPCAARLAERGVQVVWIGMYDPNPRIYRAGWRMLRDAGVQLRDFPPDLRSEIQVDNAPFVDTFRLAIGDAGTATFDYKQNGGRFAIDCSAGKLLTHWTQGGRGSIHALDYEHHVAHARYAQRFCEIDDPGALDFSNYSVLVREGEIVVFSNGSGYALVKVANVLAGSHYGDDRTELQIDYEIRIRAA